MNSVTYLNNEDEHAHTHTHCLQEELGTASPMEQKRNLSRPISAPSVLPASNKSPLFKYPNHPKEESI